MKTRNWKYKDVELSNRNTTSNIQIESVEYPPSYSGDIKSFTGTDGGYSENITSGVRQFIFTGRIYGDLASRRNAFNELKKIITYEDNRTSTSRGFYTLYWTDERGTNVQTEAKVVKPLEIEEEASGFLTFSFALLSEDNLYYSQTIQTVTGNIGEFGGFDIPFDLPFDLDSGVGFIEVTNNGNKPAPFYISVIGSLNNPAITNLTNGQSMYFANNTSILEVDNRNRPYIAKDVGVNIKGYKTGEFVYLDPGVNNILVSCSNFSTSAMGDVTIIFRDTYE